MAVGLKAPTTLYPVGGVRLGAMHCGIKSDPLVNDLTLIELAAGSSVAAVFTRNRFCAAPVSIAREHLALCPGSRYLLINSGNANAGTGDAGLLAARSTCAATAGHAKVTAESVLPFSTGVIASPLRYEKINDVIPDLLQSLDANAWIEAAQGIMTTDTLPKAFSKQLLVKGRTVTITGISKGSGMIKPDMATMLSFITTDAVIEPVALQAILSQQVADSFNSITVDGDTSTNDACVLAATGASGAVIDKHEDDFFEALTEIFQQLAQSIIRDAEGATKFIEIEVLHAENRDDARDVAYCIAHSPLVKTAMFAADPNWGRILAAVGRAPVENLDINRIDLYLGDSCLLKNGLPDPDYTEQKGQSALAGEEVFIRVDLNQGDASARIWTSDLSYEYVKINAEYRS